VTRASLREYAAVQLERYQHATRAEKHQLLDELVAVTGMHRKAAIRLLRPRSYGPDVVAAAEVLWQASGRIGAHRLHPFVGDLLERLLRCGDLTVTPAVEKLVRQASRPTLARLLAPARAQCPPRGVTTTQPGTWLKHEIPIRTFTEWDDARPGFCEVDLVAHGGSSTQCQRSSNNPHLWSLKNPHPPRPGGQRHERHIIGGDDGDALRPVASSSVGTHN
jgi:hypothetical protein